MRELFSTALSGEILPSDLPFASKARSFDGLGGAAIDRTHHRQSGVHFGK